ncbi:MAG: hypothetical protein GX587_02700 [Bacteroidales bacterium]|nr:hypothetical protein [Bacteroidales bacterium]
MKARIFLLLGMVFLFASCEEESNDLTDYRDDVVGSYFGISVYTCWQDTIVGYSHDTTDVIVNIAKEEEDSLIRLSFYQSTSSSFSFKYINGNCISCITFHAPVLKIQNDSLYFKHQPGLGPYWDECFAKKVE